MRHLKAKIQVHNPALLQLFLLTFSHSSYSVALSYCIIKYNIQHPQRNPPPRTSLTTPSPTPILQPSFPRPTSKCNQHLIRHGNRVPRNNILTYGYDDTDSHKPDHSFSGESAQSTNCRAALSGDITYTSKFHGYRSVSEDGYKGYWWSSG